MITTSNETISPEPVLKPKSLLLLPPQNLASCIAAAVVRDIRGCKLSDEERYNCFPASPMVSVTCIIDGNLKLLENMNDLDAVKTASDMERLSVFPPKDGPIFSWSEGELFAVTIAFYPDAWVKLGGNIDQPMLMREIKEALGFFNHATNSETSWKHFCEQLAPRWEAARSAEKSSDWTGSDRLSDWSKYLFGRIAMSTTGQSIRTVERRLKQWTGKTKQQLHHFEMMEQLHKKSVQTPEERPANLAVDAGFSDQSHMGRAVLRSTGFSPAKLNKLIETEEAFWCYRLLGERF